MVSTLYGRNVSKVVEDNPKNYGDFKKIASYLPNVEFRNTYMN